MLGVLLLREGRGGKGKGKGWKGKGKRGKGRQGKVTGGEEPLDLLPAEKFPSYATE